MYVAFEFGGLVVDLVSLNLFLVCAFFFFFFVYAVLLDEKMEEN